MPSPILRQEDFLPFTMEVFDRSEQAHKAAPILKGILDAQSPRLSDIAQAMPGNPQASYKALQRFLQEQDPQDYLLRLFDEEAPFILGDPTEVPRKQAKKTNYVGKLSDGKTLGFWLLTLARPYKGRAIPFAFVTYSEATLNREATSRNLEHQRVFGQVKELLGERPLVLDREFSYERHFADAAAEGVNYVVRLNQGNRPTLTDVAGNKLMLSIQPGEQVFYREVLYKGKVKGNLAGQWRQGFKQPLWVFSSLAPEVALEIYQARMKMEESFKDLKSLLGLGKIMNKKREYLEKVIALVLLAYGLGLLVGEGLREELYSGEKTEALLGVVHPAEAPGEAESARVHTTAATSVGAA